MKICFLGCGNIAQAIINGLLKSGMQPSNIACIERNEQRVKSLRAQDLEIIELENLASPVSYTHLRAPRDLSTSRMPSSA